MNTLIQRTAFAAAAMVGLAATPAIATADPTPGCGGAGQRACAAKPAIRHGKANRVGCPRGSFFDPRGGGECWTCNGKVRTVHAVTSASACGSHIFDGGGTRARFVRTVWGCGQGKFFDLVDGGSCWSCPSGHVRGLTHVKSANACTVRSACDAGMERIGAMCRPSRETQARTEAKKIVRRHGAAIVRAVELALGLQGVAGLDAALGDRDAAASAAITGSAAFVAVRDALATFETVTVGAATSAGAIAVSGGAETGVAIDTRGRRPVQWYGGTSYAIGPALSAEAGLNVGLWTAQNNALAGDSQGIVLGASDLAQLGTLLREGLDLKAGASVAVAIWFSYPDAKGNIELQGITVNPSVGVGANLGGYVRATTVQ